jgi:hypothetical protein
LFELAPDKYSTFVDLYGGGGVMALNAPVGIKRVWNDLDWFKYNVLRVVQSPGMCDALQRLLADIPYTEESFQRAKKSQAEAVVALEAASPRTWPVAAPADIAATSIVANRMSRGGLGESFAWSDRKRGGQPGDLNAWMTILASIPAIHARL